jgi:hypothetical protein
MQFYVHVCIICIFISRHNMIIDCDWCILVIFHACHYEIHVSYFIIEVLITFQLVTVICCCRETWAKVHHLLLLLFIVIISVKLFSALSSIVHQQSNCLMWISYSLSAIFYNNSTYISKMSKLLIYGYKLHKTQMFIISEQIY